MFSFARDNVEHFLKNNNGDNIDLIINELMETSNVLAEEDSYVRSMDSIDIEKISENVKHWIELDVKLKPLKDLQGIMWLKGYENGLFKAQ